MSGAFHVSSGARFEYRADHAREEVDKDGAWHGAVLDPPEGKRPTSPLLSRTAPGIAAALWALSFAAVSVYWAAGGTAGAGTVAAALAERAAERDPGFVATLWAAAAVKAALAALALALTRPRGRILRFAGWATGVGLTLYGAVGVGEFGLMALGVLEVPPDVGQSAVTWYLVLWEPIWLLGGLLFLAAARSAPRLESGGDGR